MDNSNESGFKVGARVAIGRLGEAARVVTVTRVLKSYFYTSDGCAWRLNGKPRGTDKWDSRRARLASPEDEKAARRIQAEQWMRYYDLSGVDTDVMLTCVAAMQASIKKED